MQPLIHSLTHRAGNIKPWKLHAVTMLTLYGVLSLGVHGSTKGATFTTFDAPGAGTGQGQGTDAFDINQTGVITGTYVDANNVGHGFLTPDGKTFTTFDAPGAGTGAGQGTFAFGINQTGVITGTYVDANNMFHDFFTRDGKTITTFDAPGAGTGVFQGTDISSVHATNPEGAITGLYIDASNVDHGFLRNPNGTFIAPMDPPGAVNGTLAGSINPLGAITGFYFDVNSVAHGFLRTP